MQPNRLSICRFSKCDRSSMLRLPWWRNNARIKKPAKAVAPRVRKRNRAEHTLELKRLQMQFTMMLMLNGADAADDNDDNGNDDDADAEWG